MKIRHALSWFCLFSVLTLACGKDNPISPSSTPMVASVAATTDTPVEPVVEEEATPAPSTPDAPTPTPAPPAEDCNPRRTTRRVFSADGLSITFTNNGCTDSGKLEEDYVFALFRVNDEDLTHENQTLIEVLDTSLKPGQSRTFTFVNRPTECYQSDFYGGYTKAELIASNWRANGLEAKVVLGACKPVPPPPPPPPPPPIDPPTEFCHWTPEGGITMTLPYSVLLASEHMNHEEDNFGSCESQPPPPPIDACPNLEGIQNEVPQGYRLDNENQCVLIPPPPTCAQLNPPSAGPISFTDIDVVGQGSNYTLTGTVTVSNAGTWTIRLLSASQQSEYDQNDPDSIKDTETVTLTCGNSATRSVSYKWDDHNDNYWWVEVKLNGVFYSKSVVKINTHN